MQNRINFKVGQHQPRSGFTLIELLVVIDIITLLAAILFPVFARARENARRSSCQSNLKQIGLAMIQYTQDFDERLPLGEYAISGDNYQWHDLIMPYAKSEQLFVCPSANKQTRRPFAKDNFAGGYGIPTERLIWPNPSNKAVLLATLEDPVGTIWLGDAGGGGHIRVHLVGATMPPGVIFNRPDGTPVWAYANDSNANYKHFSGRHLGGANWAYLDGHVKWMALETARDNFHLFTPKKE